MSGWRLALMLEFGAALIATTPGWAQRETVLKQINVPHHYYFREMYLPQVTSGPSAATWSPDGQELIYSMQGTLWRQKLGTTEARELTDGPGYDYQPDWSPDGRYVVYSSYRNDQIELGLLDLSTGQTSTLLGGGSVLVEPKWSPDGKRLALVSTAYNGRWHIFVGDFAAGRLTNVTRITQDKDSKLPRYYYSVFDHFISPTWSPDGKELILVSNAGRIWGTGGFWRMEAKPGAAPRELRYEETTWKARPDWSSDGKRVVYSSYLGRQWHQLWLMTSEGGDPFQLTYGDYDNTAPRWSRDTKKIAFISNQGGNTSLRVLSVPGGAIEPVKPQTLRYLHDRATLSIKVVDEANKPVAARISVTGADGRGWAPLDAWRRADNGFDRRQRPFEFTYFHARGGAELSVPAGRVTIEVMRGYEYQRVVDTVTLAPQGKTLRTIKLARLANFPATGWFSGDLHVHMNYAGTYRNTPADLRFQAEAEDLSVVENLIVNKEQRIPDIGYFRGGDLDPASTAATLIKHDEEFHTSYWGHSGHIGLTRSFLMPNYAAYVNTAAASPYPHNSAVFDLTHQQGGLAGYVHPFESVPNPAKDEALTHGFPIEAALDKVDYLELCSFTDHLATSEVWFRLLNTGFRVSAGAGTDAMMNYASLHGPVGLCRVYAESGKLDYKAWLGAINAGRTFATNGPLLRFTLAGKGIGSEIRLAPGQNTVDATVSMRSNVPVDSVQLIQNGQVALAFSLSRDSMKVDESIRINVIESSWYVVRAFSHRSRHPVLDLYPFAITSPIYVIVGDQSIRSPKDAAYFVAWLDRLERNARDHKGWNTEDERRAVLADIDRARAIFRERSTTSKSIP